jgi:Glycoside hydrolase family 44
MREIARQKRRSFTGRFAVLLLLLGLGLPAFASSHSVRASRSSSFIRAASIVDSPGSTPTALVSAYLVGKGGAKTIVLGGTLQFVAYGTYSDGSVASLPDAQGNRVTAWNTSNHLVAKISSLGHVTATGVGIANVEASIGALQASSWQVTVTPPPTATAPSTDPITVAISPSTITRRCLTSVTFTGTVTNTAITTVEWSVNDIVGGNNTVGTITSTGVYTAPGSPPGVALTVIATSAADTTKSAKAVVLLQNAIPIITGATSPIIAGTTASLTILGAGFAQYATVSLGNMPLNMTWANSTHLTATGFIEMPAGGQAALAVLNPDPGSARSNRVTIQIDDPSGLPVLSVDATQTGRHAISPEIYGIAYGPGLTPPDVDVVKQIQLPNIRWGGNAATNYNWQADLTNAGNDYYFINFRNYTEPSPTPGYMVDQMIATNTAAYSGVHPLVTVPIIPWIADGSTMLCSYPISVYGAQQSSTVFTGQSCGNGVSVDGTPILDSSVSLNYIQNSTAIQKAWVDHLVSKFGIASSGGVTYYQLDNEPSAWHGTHRDLEPVQPDYDTIVSLGTQYASMIKAQDPSAKILGPSDYTEYGWTWNVPVGTSLYAGQYYLQQMAAYAVAHGNARILDYFDEHWACPDMSSAAAELNSTRTLWDPSYNTGSPFEIHMAGPVMMIPRFQNWVSSYYPGTQISISEYECVAKPGSPTIIDAVAEADILGVFGAQGVALANNFNIPRPNDPLSFSYLMYRNYDGQGSKFGDTSVTSASTVPATLSVHGALRSSDGKLTVMVINKTSSTINTQLSLANFNATSTAAVYTYSSADLSLIVAGPPVPVSSNTVGYGFPAYSATLFVFDPTS